MDSELHKLRIDKSQKASRQERSIWPVLLVLILIVGAGVGFFVFKKANAGVAVQTIRVTVPAGTVNESDLVMLNATGYIMAAHKIELASKVIGRVSWVGVEMGDKIEKGQILVTLEDDEYKARVAEQQGLLDNAKAKLAELQAGSRPQEIAQAEASLAQAEAEYRNAEINYKRMKENDDSRFVSKQQIDDAEALVHSRRSQIEIQRQLLDLAKAGPRKEVIEAQKATVRQLEGSLALVMVELNNTIIRSTIAGTVLERNVEVGEFVTTGFVGDRGAKGYVVSIADLMDLRVELDISQNDFAKVKPRQPCWIVTDAYPDRRYEGQVDLISPEANRQKATVQVRVKVLNPDELLKPDMNATVSFLNPAKLAATTQTTTKPTGERPAIRVPASAIKKGNVFVVENGKAVSRAVQTGATSKTGEIEIKKGLIGGEDLITNPPDTLKDGDAIKIQN